MEQGIVVQGIAYDKNIAKINILGITINGICRTKPVHFIPGSIYRSIFRFSW
ncbi:hypothetical protein [Paenibacillus oleatilyticus]|uniref:Uncharacterized protein n=1 Tax=Paenibacillus oleatilyticus TaxID=2594886 RepID=A0ABV4UWT5_9BACL